MNKYKKIIFYIIVVSTIFFTLVQQFGNPKLFFVDKDNIELKAGRYKAGKDIPIGVYDVEVIKGSICYGGTKLEKGEKFIADYLGKNYIVDIEGSGTVMLQQHHIQEIKKVDGIYTIKNNGNYKIGQHLEEGKYEIKYFNPKSKLEDDSAFIDIENDDSKPRGLYLKHLENEIITLNNDETLQVFMGLFDKCEDSYIELKRQ